MKSFKKFLNSAVVITAPIHFRMGAVSQSLNASTASKRDMKENIEDFNKHSDVIHAMTSSNGGDELHSKHDRVNYFNYISSDIHARQPKLTSEQKEHIKWYTGEGVYGNNSGEVNKQFIKNYNQGAAPEKDQSPLHMNVDKTIRELSKRGLKEPLSVYSGIPAHFIQKVEKSNNKTLFSPAHISATHNGYVATAFARESVGREGEKAHIMHIRLKPGDKAFHAGTEHSTYGYEHETIIPRGTTLRYLGTTEHVDNKPEDNMDQNSSYSIHHFEISHQQP